MPAQLRYGYAKVTLRLNVRVNENATSGIDGRETTLVFSTRTDGHVCVVLVLAEHAPHEVMELMGTVTELPALIETV